MKSITLPLPFVRSRLELTWSDVEWGFRHGWFDASGVVEYAVAWLVEDRKESQAVVELAGITRKELAEVPFLLERIVNATEDDGSSDSKGKWLCLALAWAYEHRAELEDPLGVVENLYADFDYPEELRGLVRYMPPEGHYEPQAHTHSENIAHLFSKWAEYLDSRCPPRARKMEVMQTYIQEQWESGKSPIVNGLIFADGSIELIDLEIAALSGGKDSSSSF